MTLLQIRTKLRRRINDVDAQEWSDAELNGEINVAYAWVQKEIFKVKPDAHLFWDYMDQTSGTIWYPLPATFAIKEFAHKLAASDTTYTKLYPKRYDDIRDLTAGSGPYYAMEGEWVGIFPAPDLTITNGLRIRHVPVMTLSADTDIPLIKLPLHEAIVLRAKDQIMGDLDAETADRNRLGDLINDLPLWYGLHLDEPDRLQIGGLGTY